MSSSQLSNSAMASKITVTVVLTQEEKDQLRSIAEAEDRSLSYIAGRFVREGLDRLKGKERGNK